MVAHPRIRHLSHPLERGGLCSALPQLKLRAEEFILAAKFGGVAWVGVAMAAVSYMDSPRTYTHMVAAGHPFVAHFIGWPADSLTQ